MKNEFTHLNVWSDFTFKRSMCKIEEIVLAAKRNGMHAVALTDLWGLRGAVMFDNYCREHEIKPIIGCEIVIEPFNEYGFSSPLILIVKNNNGYRNLCCLLGDVLTSQASKTPTTVSLEKLKGYAEGLICIVGGASNGEIVKKLLSGKFKEAAACADALKKVFGINDFYIELNRTRCMCSKNLLNALTRFCVTCNLSPLATNEVRYINPDDDETFCNLLRIRDDTLGDNTFPSYLWRELTDVDGMIEFFKKTPKAIDNTMKIANKCDFSFSRLDIAQYGCESISNRYENPRVALSEICLKKIRKKYDIDPGCSSSQQKNKFAESVIKRLELELEFLQEQQLIERCLLMIRLKRMTENHEFQVEVDDGVMKSGGIISYLTGFSHIDPMRFHICFEIYKSSLRFCLGKLGEFEIRAPQYRHRAINEFLLHEFGEMRIAKLRCYSSWLGSFVMLKMARLMNSHSFYSPNDAQCVHSSPYKRAAIFSNPDGYNEFERKKQYFDAAAEVISINTLYSDEENTVYVVGEDELSYTVPLERSSKSSITSQYDLSSIRSLGLAVIYLVGDSVFIPSAFIKILRKKGVSVLISDIPLDDTDVFKSFTDDTFILELYANHHAELSYIEKERVRLAEDIEIQSIEDISTMTAVLILTKRRKMDDLMERFIARKNSNEYQTGHSMCDSILCESRGFILYTDQIFDLLTKVAGFSIDKAMNLIAVKNVGTSKDIIFRESEQEFDEKLEKSFIDGCVANGMKQKSASELFQTILRVSQKTVYKSLMVERAINYYLDMYFMLKYAKYFEDERIPRFFILG